MAICQNCNKEYDFDIIVPDDVWNKVRSMVGNPEGTGLLCPECIISSVKELGWTAGIIVDVDTVDRTTKIGRQLNPNILEVMESINSSLGELIQIEQKKNKESCVNKMLFLLETDIANLISGVCYPTDNDDYISSVGAYTYEIITFYTRIDFIQSDKLIKKIIDSSATNRRYDEVISDTIMDKVSSVLRAMSGKEGSCELRKYKLRILIRLMENILGIMKAGGDDQPDRTLSSYLFKFVNALVDDVGSSGIVSITDEIENQVILKLRMNSQLPFWTKYLTWDLDKILKEVYPGEITIDRFQTTFMDTHVTMHLVRDSLVHINYHESERMFTTWIDLGKKRFKGQGRSEDKAINSLGFRIAEYILLGDEEEIKSVLACIRT